MWLCVFLTQYLHFGGGKYPQSSKQSSFLPFYKVSLQKIR